jgi:hypothetical protein
MKRWAWIAPLTCLLGVMLAPATAAASGPPSDIATGTAEPSETSAVVLGYFNYGQTYPPSIAESCWFDYGTTLAFGGRTEAVCSGTTKATLAPLVPGTTYYYRAAASNAGGTTNGPTKTFTTLGSAPPPAGTPPPANTPSASLSVVAGQSLGSVLRSGLRLRVRVTGPCPCVIRGRLLVSHTTTVSRRELGTAGTANVTLKPKASVRRKLRHSYSLKVTVRVSVTGPSGKPIVVSRSVRLKRTK